MNEILIWLEQYKDPSEVVDMLIQFDGIDYEELLDLLEPYIRECKEDFKDEMSVL